MARTSLGDWGTYYAKSGTSSPSSNDYQTRWSLSYEQDIANKRTTVYVQPYLRVSATGGADGSISATINTTINGSSKSQTINFDDAFYTSGTRTKYGSTHSFVINHGSDGTASCRFSGNMVSGIYVGSTNIYTAPTRTASHTWTLPTINVASGISNNTSAGSRIDFGQPITFTITRPNDTVTHTLTYVENNQTITIGTGLGTSATYTFPTSYINNIPSSPEKDYIVTCVSSNGTVSTTTVHLKVPDSYKPSVALSVTDGNSITRGWGIWVQNRSVLNFSLTPTLSAGSPIKTYYTNINDTIYYEQSKTLDKFNYSGTVNIVSNVTDNRNRVSANQTKTLTVYPYSNPTFIKCEVVRCDSTGEEDNNGTYGKIKCSYSISPCNNKNAKSLIVTYGSTSKTIELSEYSATDKTSGSAYDFSGLSGSANHTFTFKLTDSFTTTEQNYVMPPSFVLISYYKGGKGITFGQVATEEGFHNYMNSVFHAGLTIPTETLLGAENLKTKIDEKQNSGYYCVAGEKTGTLEELYNACKTLNGSIGSISLVASNGIPGAWYNYVYIPHRHGGTTGDNKSFGTILLFPMNSSGNCYIVRCSGDAIAEVRVLMTSTSPGWNTVTTTKGWSANTPITYSNVLENAIGVWIAGRVNTANTGVSALFIPIPLITTSESNFLINDEAYWVRTSLYRNGNDLIVTDKGRSKDGYVSTIMVMKSA